MPTKASNPTPLYGEHLESLPHPPSTILLLRTPISPAEGTDPYHDAFGGFCLPGFEISALDSGSSTPITLSPSNPLKPLSSLPSSSAPPPNHQEAQSPDPQSLHDALSSHSQSSISDSNYSTGSTTMASASTQSSLGGHLEKEKRKGRWIRDEGLLTTHHLSYGINPDEPDGEEVEREYCVSSIPILSHRVTNLEELANRLVFGVGQEEKQDERREQEQVDDDREARRLPYRGMIISSQRAVEALTGSIPLAVEMLCKETPKGKSPGDRLQQGGIQKETESDESDTIDDHEKKENGRGHSIPLTPWSTTPFFAVGPATQTALQGVSDSLVYSSQQDSRLIHALAPSIVLGGAETGNAEALGQFILEHFQAVERRSVVFKTPSSSASSDGNSDSRGGRESQAAVHPEAPVLILQGDKSLGTLPKVLSSANPPIPQDIIKVYETCAHENFSDSCSRLTRTLTLARRSASRRGSGTGPQHQAAAAAAVASLAQAVGADYATPAQIDSHTSSILASRSRRGSNQSSITAAARAELGNGFTPLPHAQASASSETGNSFSISTTGAGARFSANSTSLSISPPTVDRLRPPPDWLVFFSPSGVQYALPELRSRGWFPPAPSPPEAGSVESRLIPVAAPAPPQYPRIAVLGPTTKRYLRDELNLAADAVAAVPGPSELREAIRMAEKRIAKDRKREEARLVWAENRKKSAIAKSREMELASIEAGMIPRVKSENVRDGSGNGNGKRVVDHQEQRV